MIGFFGGRAGVPASRLVAATARPRAAKRWPTHEALLGEELPDHARPERRASIARLRSLPCAVARSGRGIARDAGPGNVFSQIAIFFSTMAVVTFGGAYAVLAYVAQQAVENYGWLRPGEMLDGLGMAETTPGPLIMVLQFVGFMGAYRDPGSLSPLSAGTLGGLLATWVTFVPCFLFIFLGAPFIEVLRGNEALHGALSAITAAVVGRRAEPRRYGSPSTLFSAKLGRWRASGSRFDAPVLGKRRPLGAAPLGGGRARDVPVQGRHDPNARGVLRGWDCPLRCGGNLMRVALRTKADSVAHFDILHVRALR